ncbi:hypothetical protein [Archaeoglobus neptunius]|uniref:hypothetical protein n=1 Tax=Archaeoglobus neptunius TaxID=2798580 RepID=UPI00192604B0|nr:hypothetical protein [Archaeoglobus neptunius]
MEKLSHLLEHWLEHSREHTMKYEEWADKIADEAPEVSELLKSAAEKFREGEAILENALRKVRHV